MSAEPVNEYPQKRWHPLTRIAFRFAFVYLLLFNLPFPLSAFPYVDKVAEPYNSFWSAIVTRTARVVLNREIPSVFNGSGDRAYDFLYVACLLVLAVVGTIVCVLSNVVALNFSYDVPVKLFSLHLLGMAVSLLIPDARRLANVFFLNRPAEPVKPKPLFRRTLLNLGALLFGSLFLIGVVGVSLYQSYDQRRFLAQRSPLYGVWEVEEFSLGESQPAAPVQRWHRVIFDSPNRVAVQTITNAQERFRLQLDEQNRTLTLRKREDPNWQTVLTYQQVTPGVLTLTGELGGSQLNARLRRTDEPQFLLTNRGFHWINEVPFNR